MQTEMSWRQTRISQKFENQFQGFRHRVANYGNWTVLCFLRTIRTGNDSVTININKMRLGWVSIETADDFKLEHDIHKSRYRTSFC